MTAITPPSAESADLDHPDGWGFSDRAFFAETVELLRSVRDHDFDTLANRCDDDFGIIDIDPEGNNVPIRTRAEWEAWFRGLFAQLDAMNAATDSIVLGYEAIEAADMGYSVLDFRQTLTIGAETATFDCVATIVWKATEDGWREARWHGSLLNKIVPEAMSAAAGV